MYMYMYIYMYIQYKVIHKFIIESVLSFDNYVKIHNKPFDELKLKI